MKTKQKLALYLLSLTSLLVLWQILANQLNPMILASPWQTLMQLFELILTADFWQQLLVTLNRLLYALSIACSIGFTLGLIAGRHAWLKFYLAPFRWLLMSIPPVIIVLLAMLWFGMGSTMVVFITVLLLTPTIYINTQKSVEQIDNHWFELAQVYQFSWYQRLSKIYIPAISGPLCATLIIVCCSGVRIVVLAEVLGAHQGIGFELANASSNFDTAELYAWVVVSLSIVAFMELILLKPIQYYLLRWRKLS
ncbi:MAG: ABC transporter permease [Colwellia sp.]|nr:MAG: ABC transporter permease [Colwellia sp.]